MLLIKLIILSFGCLVCCSYTINGSTAITTINTHTHSNNKTNNNNSSDNNNNNDNNINKKSYGTGTGTGTSTSHKIKQDNKRMANATIKESNIYNIKRLLPAKATRTIIRKSKATTKTPAVVKATTVAATVEATNIKNTEKMRKPQQEKQQHHQHEHEQQLENHHQEIMHRYLRVETNSVGDPLMQRKETATAVTPIMAKATTIFKKKLTPAQQRKAIKMRKYKNSTKNSHKLNKKMLSKLGFTKVKAPNSHNRKRLAIESRHHASPDDSHMFIVKLPPNMHYYSNPKASDNNGKTAMNAATKTAASSYNSLIPNKADKNIEEGKSGDVNENKVSFPFNSNGKPGRIYHWNLPIIEKILQDKKRFPNITNTEQLIDIKNIPTWSKPWENESIEKSFGHDALTNFKKTMKRKSPTYYAPANTVNKNSFNKYFSGNGKPKGFYVIKENQKKPKFYKHIIA